MGLKINNPLPAQADEQTRILFGDHCPMVCLIRVRPVATVDELGTVPMFFIDEEDGRMKAGAHLDVIRQDCEKKQFLQETFFLVSPMDEGGQEKRVKHFPLRPQRGEKLVIGLKGRSKLFSELNYKWASKHTEQIAKYEDLFNLSYGMADLAANKEEPQALLDLPRRLNGIRILSPEKASFTRMDTDDEGQEFEKEILCKPRFFGEYCYQDALEQTTKAFKARHYLDITGMPVGIHPFVLRVDVEDALDWKPYHITALANASSGIPVMALDREYWSKKGLWKPDPKTAEVSLSGSMLERLGNQKEVVRDTLDRIGAARVASKVLEGNTQYFEKMKGVGVKTANQILNQLGEWAEANRNHHEVVKEMSEKVLY